jgi:hypothetical protein
MKFQGRGKVYIAERNSTTGKPGIFKFVGCADALNIALNVETIQHFSKCTSADALDYQGTRSQSAEVTMTLSEWSKQNLLVALRGEEVPDETSGSATAEAQGSGFAVGDVFFLGATATGIPKTNVSSVVIDDSSGELVLDTDYTLDPDTGRVEFLVAPTGAVTADYTYDNLPYIAMFKAGSKDYWLRFDGVNKADSDDKFAIDLYKVQFTPAANMDLLSDELALLELGGAVLVDDTKDSDGDLGQFGRMTVLQSVA